MSAHACVFKDNDKDKELFTMFTTKIMRNIIALHGVPSFVVSKVWEPIHENHPDVNEDKLKNGECLLWDTCCLKEQLNCKTMTK